MNIFNRIVIVILLILALVGVTAVCLFPDPFIARLVSFIDWLELDGLGSRMELVHRLILIGVAAIVDIILTLLLVLELRRPKPKAVRVQQVDGGTVMLTADSIRSRLGFYIDGLEDVVSVKPRVQIKRDKVMVAVDVQTSAIVNVPAKAQEVVSIIRMVVGETLGLELSEEPRVNIRTQRADKYVPAAEPMFEPVLEEE
jgi:hypothetical protein